MKERMCTRRRAKNRTAIIGASRKVMNGPASRESRRCASGSPALRSQRMKEILPHGKDTGA
jgi:hypothetical protein